ncbi:MAG: GrpB family protein [Bacteroidota bacterium]
MFTVKKEIKIENYDPAWALEFQQLKSVYQSNLGDLICGIEHVGSTAVEGLAAKAIIDIDLVIADRTILAAVIEKLAALGYAYRGNQGITDREAFKRLSDQTPLDGSGRTWPNHHLYVCPQDSVSLRNHITLRDVLRSNPDKMKAYDALKKQLAAEHRFNMDLYIEKKTPFITEILKEAGFDDSSIDNIVLENRVSK